MVFVIYHFTICADLQKSPKLILFLFLFTGFHKMSQIDCTPDNFNITEDHQSSSSIDKKIDNCRIESSLKEVNTNNLNLNSLSLYGKSSFSRRLKRSISIDDSENVFVKRQRTTKSFANFSPKLQVKPKNFKRNSAPDILSKNIFVTNDLATTDQELSLQSFEELSITQNERRKNTQIHIGQPIENRLASVTSSSTTTKNSNESESKSNINQENKQQQQKESSTSIKRKPSRKLPSRSTNNKRLKLLDDSTNKNLKSIVNHQKNSAEFFTKPFKVATRQQTRKLAFISPIDSQSIDDYTFGAVDHNEVLPVGYDTDTVISRTGGGRQLLYPIAPSTNTMATLCNIGNTCYLNSVVYTLRFAPFFLHNLHHLVDDLLQIDQKFNQNKAKSSSLGRNVGGLQGPNSRSWSTKDLASVGGGGGGSGGSNNGSSIGNGSINSLDVEKAKRQIATEKLHELYHNLYRNEMSEITEAYHTDTFLNAVQDVSSIFSGNQQQDAHEFLMCVLDSIRDTSQRLTKIIADCPDIVLNG